MLRDLTLRSIVRASMEEAVIDPHGVIDPDVNTSTAGALASNPDIAAEQPTVGLFGATGTNWHEKVIAQLDIPHLILGAEPPKPPVQEAPTDGGKAVVAGIVQGEGCKVNPNEAHKTEGNEVGQAVAQTEGGALSNGQGATATAPAVTADLPSVGAESQQLDAAAAAPQMAAIPQAPEYCMYVLTPEDIGYKSVAQVASAAAVNPTGTVVAFAPNEDGSGFPADNADEIGAVKAMLSDAGANVFDSLTASVEWLNEQARS